MDNDDDKRAYLERQGWSTWYNPNYWVHLRYGTPARDYTYFGLPLDEAVAAEQAHIAGLASPRNVGTHPYDVAAHNLGLDRP